MIHTYNDIIDLPHHVSSTYPPMRRIDRAAQFSPFAALAGYDAAIQETGRLTEQRIDLTEESKVVLDLKLHLLMQSGEKHPQVRIKYFVPDPRKDGGEYVIAEGRVKRIQQIQRMLIFTDGRLISLDDVVDIECTESNNSLVEYP